jgi:hypothetical protein
VLLLKQESYYLLERQVVESIAIQQFWLQVESQELWLEEQMKREVMLMR